MDVERLHAAMSKVEREVTRQGVVLGRDADLSDYADAVAIALAVPAVTETDLRDAEGLLADSYVANSDLRVALLRIFDLAEDRPDIRAVAREALHKKESPE